MKEREGVNLSKENYIASTLKYHKYRITFVQKHVFSFKFKQNSNICYEDIDRYTLFFLEIMSDFLV